MSNTPPTPSRHDELLTAALAYAERGLYVLPLHEPLFDQAGNCCGCTCEAYKRSNKYRDWLRTKGKEKRFDPNFKCRTPGKHPRISDWETQATTDPAQIRTWWQRWPTANVGIAAGKSGLLTFDRDTYKEIFGDDSELFTKADKETPTQISQKGGEHLVFAKPEGKVFTNANNTLPPGVDIRCDGGMFAVEPSIGPTGNQWTWEDGYSILECTPRPLPPALVDLLDAAHQNSAPANLVNFTEAPTERPDLIRWRISKTIRELIHNPPPVGQRSEADAKVCVSLVYAGATDDDILSVFQHYPIGTAGKYGEAGPVYLARTIGKARAYVDAHPRPDVVATLAALRLAIKTHNLTDHTGPGPGSKKLRPVADAVFDLMQEDTRFEITAGKKRLGKYAGVSPNTVVNALSLLNGVLFDVTPTEAGFVIRLVENRRFQFFDPPVSVVRNVNTGGQKIENDNPTPEINVYSPHKTDEPFLTGTSRYVREKFEIIAQALDITVKEAKKCPIYNEVTGQEEYTHPGLGEGVLLAYDTALRIGDLTAQEYAAATGLKLSAARGHLRRAERMGLAEAEREGSRGPKVYSFIPEFWQRVEELAPNLRTRTLTSQRENIRLKGAQVWCERELQQAKQAHDTEKAQQLEQRRAKLAAQRVTHLSRLLEGKATPEEIKEIAYNPGVPFGPHPAVQAKLERMHAQARAEARQQEQGATAPPPAPSYAPAVGDVLTQHGKKILVNRLVDRRVIFEVYDLGVREGEFSLPVDRFTAQVVGSRPRVERQGVAL